MRLDIFFQMTSGVINDAAEWNNFVRLSNRMKKKKHYDITVFPERNLFSKFKFIYKRIRDKINTIFPFAIIFTSYIKYYWKISDDDFNFISFSKFTQNIL